MEDFYSLHPSVNNYASPEQLSLMSSENLVSPMDYQSLLAFRDRIPIFGSNNQFFSAAASSVCEPAPAALIAPKLIHQQQSGGRKEEDMMSGIKAKIAAHPRYPTLLQAYIDCQKVGAPSEVACLLEEIRQENQFFCNNKRNNNIHVSTTILGDDPELDDFMETYCDVLVKYKSDLSRPFEEATTFLNKIEMQLTNLCCKPPSSAAASRTSCVSDEPVGSSDDDLSGGEVAEVQEVQPRLEERDLKDKLLRKYSGYISSLKQEFSKKKKKGKLPKEARQTLLDWWNIHNKWPYPTEADKIALAEVTGLDQKQINNWFINQRKRHWKPSENMQFAVMDSLSAPFYIDD